MEEDKSTNQTMTITGITEEGAVCPFSRGKWKKIGDALVFFMLFVAPILYLVVFLITG